jgi:UDP-glucose 4-epimerase
MRLELPDTWKAESRSVLVTGCAGFLGSSLSDALLEQGHEVLGIDSFSDYYDPAQKRKNLARAEALPNFNLIEADLNELDLADLLRDRSYCFHFAAQAGVRASWGSEFHIYLDSNIHATQRLLEAILKVREQGSDFQRLIYSSSSSVYGNQERYPVAEDVDKRPFSPYGVSKLAAEQLCALYAENFDVPSSSLRYFTVYGPRQRPDMAFRKFLEAARRGEPWRIYGDGEQTRDFTFVNDAIRANLLAADDPSPYGVYNIGGGSRVSLLEALGILRERALEHGVATEIKMEHTEVAKGDVRHTYADGTRAREVLGFVADVPLEAGLDAEASWVAANPL